jgi:hypothetical protein
MSSRPNQKPNTSHELVIFNIDHLIENARKADAPNRAITGKKGNLWRGIYGVELTAVPDNFQ